MIDGILIKDFRQEYSENLLPVFDGDLVIQSGTNANLAYDTSIRFKGDKSIKLTCLTTGGLNPINFYIDNYTTTIKNTGSHIFSVRLYSDNIASNSYLTVKAFVNSVLLTTRAIGCSIGGFDEDIQDKWLTFAQSFNLSKDDIVTFVYEYKANIIGSNLYMDGLKLEYDDRYLGTPSMYSLPLSELIEETGFQSRSDTVSELPLISLNDNVMQITGASNGNLTSLLDSNSKITPTKLNSVITISFACTFVTIEIDAIFIDIKLKVGTEIYRGFRFTPVNGLDDMFSVSWSMPIDSYLLSNGAEIIINPSISTFFKDRYITVIQG